MNANFALNEHADAQRKLAELIDHIHLDEKRNDPESQTHKKTTAKHSTSESDDVSIS